MKMWDESYTFFRQQTVEDEVRKVRLSEKKRNVKELQNNPPNKANNPSKIAMLLLFNKRHSRQLFSKKL